MGNGPSNLARTLSEDIGEVGLAFLSRVSSLSLSLFLKAFVCLFARWFFVVSFN